ncbi:MAG: TetR/AcrR family transcriptional regulator [Halioglobus sp.]|nr:TetR/AcrR family transcriptional regulator [Halioglobus sp.]
MTEFDLEAALDRTEQNPNKTSARLLREAETLFAKRGFQGVRTREVAGAAEVNISTLHFHWKNKRTLYEAVCRWHARLALAALEQAAQDFIPNGRPGQKQIEGTIDQVVRLLTEHPAMAPLALQSVSDRTAPELPSLFQHDVALFRFSEQSLEKVMSASGPDPAFSILSVFYFVIVAFGDSTLQRAALGGSLLEEPEVQDRFKRFLTRLLMSLLDDGDPGESAGSLSPLSKGACVD